MNGHVMCEQPDFLLVVAAGKIPWLYPAVKYPQVALKRPMLQHHHLGMGHFFWYPKIMDGEY